MIKNRVIGNILLINYFNNELYFLLILIHMNLTLKESFICQKYQIKLKSSVFYHSYF